MQMQDQIKELQSLIQLNRQALKIMTPSNLEDQHKGLLMVLKNLQEENALQSKQIDRLIAERNEAQNQVLINQQITESAQRHEQELVASLEDKISRLQSNLNKAETELSKLEQMRPEYDEVAGVVIKYRDVIEPNTVLLKMHNEIQMLNEQLVQQFKEKIKFQQEKDNIQGLNFKLTSEVIRLKSVNLHGGNKVLFTQTPDQLIKFQQNLLQSIKQNDESSNPSSSPAESPLMSPLPAKNDIQQSSQTTKCGIPKLDLTKAKQIQEINAKRQIQQVQDKQKSNMDIQSLEKLQKLEKTLDDVRKNYQREMLLNRTYQLQNDDLRRECEDLEHRLNLLISSNLRYQEKLLKINRQYSFLQQFYMANKDQCQTTFSNNRRISSLEQDFTDLQLDTSMIDANEQIISPDRMQDEKPQAQFYQYYMPNNNNDSKKFLLSLAEQMYSLIEEKLTAVINGEHKLIQHRTRSVSDIIDYSNK